jgi:hypothetical protein
MRGTRVWRPRGGRASLFARLAKERSLGRPVEATALDASILRAPVGLAHEEEAEHVALVARVGVIRLGELATLRVDAAQRRIRHFVAARTHASWAQSRYDLARRRVVVKIADSVSTDSMS